MKRPWRRSSRRRDAADAGSIADASTTAECPAASRPAAKDRAVVVGNCQAAAVEHMLLTNDAFAARFELVRFPPVHEIADEQVPVLHETIAGAAVVILQRVDDSYRDGIGLGTETLAGIAGDASVVRWPSVYWAGYVPDLFYLRGPVGEPVVDGPFDYHDRAVLQAYVDGFDVDATLALLADPAPDSDAAKLAETATRELATRGAGCDVDVAPYIAEHFRDRLLFFTMNHPTNELIAHITQQMVALLGLPGSVDPTRFGDEMLGSTWYPLHANHVRALGLRFRGEAGERFRIRGRNLEPAAAIRSFFDYYDAHPTLVELNHLR